MSFQHIIMPRGGDYRAHHKNGQYEEEARRILTGHGSNFTFTSRGDLELRDGHQLNGENTVQHQGVLEALKELVDETYTESWRKLRCGIPELDRSPACFVTRLNGEQHHADNIVALRIEPDLLAHIREDMQKGRNPS